MNIYNNNSNNKNISNNKWYLVEQSCPENCGSQRHSPPGRHRPCPLQFRSQPVVQQLRVLTLISHVFPHVLLLTSSTRSFICNKWYFSILSTWKSILKLPLTSSTRSFIGNKTKLESGRPIIEEAHVPNSVAAKSLDWYRSFLPCLDTWKKFTLRSSALWRCQVCLKKQRAYFSSQETDRGAGFPWQIFDLDGCCEGIQPSRDESHWAPPGKKAQLRWSGHWSRIDVWREKQKVLSKFDRRKEWLLPILCIPDTAAFWSKRQKRRKKMEKKPEVSQRRQHPPQHQLSRWSWAGEHRAWGEHY